VRLLGQRADVPRLLAGLDLFVLPSLWEGLPYALLEAGAAGLPVVATDIPGNRDLITPGQTGYLARPNDPLDLAVTLLRALRDPERPRLGQRLQVLVRSEYSLEQMIAAHAELYAELASG
jgi:glycosyltransferase involved in cell wall biosynthesis